MTFSCYKGNKQKYSLVSKWFPVLMNDAIQVNAHNLLSHTGPPMFANLYSTLYGSFLWPDDDFFTGCQKAVITSYFVFGTINVSITTVATVIVGHSSVVKVVIAVSLDLASVIWIAPWTYAKFTRTSPDWLVKVDLEAALLILVYTALFLIIIILSSS